MTHDLEQLRVKYLGKKGPIQELMKTLKDIPPAEKPAFGQQVNGLKATIGSTLDTLTARLIEQEESTRLTGESIDITGAGPLPLYRIKTYFNRGDG